MTWVVNTGPNRAGSCIRIKTFYTQFSQKRGKTKETSPRSPFMFIYLSLPEPWISYLEYCCIDRFLPVCFSRVRARSMTITVHYVVEKYFFKRKLFFFKDMRGIGLGKKRQLLIAHSVIGFVESFWRPLRRESELGCVWGTCAFLAGSEQGCPGLPAITPGYS